MAFVLDASVTIAWAMQDESDPLVNFAFGEIERVSALVPMIWWYEVRNILIVNERRGRIDSSASNTFLNHLQGLRIRIDPLELFDRSSKLPGIARSFGLTVYDAAYFQIALRENLPLATLDKNLETQLSRPEFRS
jgi:predicted nucleic acid-binding protein